MNMGPRIVRSGLVLNLDAGQKTSYSGTGTTWYDLSGNRNNGALTNGPAFSSANGGSIVFDGVNDYVSVADNSVLDIAGDKTLCCWINLASDANIGIAGKMSNVLYGMSIAYGWDSKGFQAIAWNSTNSPQLDKDSNRDLTKWNYLVAVQSSTTRLIYAFDSIGVRSATGGGGTHTWNNSLNFTIGSNTDGYYVPANTKIPIVQVYNRALSQTELQQNFNATKTRFGL